MIGKLYAPIILLGMICTLAVSLYCFLHGNNLGGLGAGFLAVALGFVAALGASMARQHSPLALKQMRDDAYQEGYEAACRDMQMRVNKSQRLRQDR